MFNYQTNLESDALICIFGSRTNSGGRFYNSTFVERTNQILFNEYAAIFDAPLKASCHQFRDSPKIDPFHMTVDILVVVFSVA
jgi:hypothetical protein